VIAVSPDGRHVASAGTGQTITVHDARSLVLRARLRGSEDGIHSLAFSPDGNRLVSGGNDHVTRVWNPEPPYAAPGVETDGAGNDFSKGLRAASPAGDWVGDGEGNGLITLEDPDRRHAIRRIAGPPGVYARLVAAPDGSRLAALSWPRDLYVADLPDGEWRTKWRLSEGTVGPIVFSPDGRRLASGGDDNLITVRSTADGSTLAVLRGHREELVALAFTPDGSTLASSSTDGTLRLWHLPTWREVGTLYEGEIIRRLEFDAAGGELRAMDGGGRTRCFPGRE
jgi:WD40 repeat protein